MNPDNNQIKPPTSLPPPVAPNSEVASRQREATVNIVRSQIDSMFDQSPQPQTAPVAQDQHEQVTPTGQPSEAQPRTMPSGTQPGIIQRTKDNVVEPLAEDDPIRQQYQPKINENDWKVYHSAWQNYYQHYYEKYYQEQVAAAKQSLGTSAQTANIQNTVQENTQIDSLVENRKKAVEELREKLLKKVEDSAGQVRRSRHFIPIISTVFALLLFGFLQYNEILIANVKAYVTPGAIDPANIIVDPKATNNVSPEPRLIIPKINVDTPVTYDISTDTLTQNKAMENGIAHFPIPGANSHPGEIGNTVLSGHSSNDVFAPGDYKYIFMQLDKLTKGDVIYANYKGKRYTYIVTKKEVVAPSNVGSLIYETDKPILTLITCTPLGTALNRLLVTAEQIYPETSRPAPEPQAEPDQAPVTIPGEGSPSILSRLFGS